MLTKNTPNISHPPLWPIVLYSLVTLAVAFTGAVPLYYVETLAKLYPLAGPAVWLWALLCFLLEIFLAFKAQQAAETKTP